MNNKRRVTQAFDAKHVASRSREKFNAGELLMVVASPEAPEEMRFMRINGLRPHSGVERQYILLSEELDSKTEVAQ